MQLCGRLEDLGASAGIVQVDAHDGAYLMLIGALVVGLGEIGLVLGLELLAGEVAAVVDLADEPGEQGVVHTDGKVGLAIRLVGDVHQPTVTQAQVADNGAEKSAEEEDKKRDKNTHLTAASFCSPRHCWYTVMPALLATPPWTIVMFLK